MLQSIKTGASSVAKSTKNRARLVVAAVAAAPVLAFADPAADPGIQAIQDLQSKGTAYIAAAFAVAVLMAGGFWGIKVMKKSFGAAK